MNRPVKYPVISLFSGAMGLDLGLKAAGLSIRVAVDCNRSAVDTIRANCPRLPVIDKPVENTSTAELLSKAELAVGEAFAVVGGPSCQSFSTAGQRLSLNDARGTTFREFARVVREARPRFFVMENVRGLLSAAVRHRTLARRGPGYPPLTPEEQLGSAFRVMLKELADTNYYVVFDVLNAAEYGVAQIRHRLIIFGSRDGELLSMPPPSHATTPTGTLRREVTLREALADLDDSSPEFESVPHARAKLLAAIPPGGNWRALPAGQRRKAIGSAFDSWGGRSGFLRRLDWDRPAPSVTSRPSGKATFMCHPDEARALSIAECAKLQQFPTDWVFEGSLLQRYAQIGNAVPIGLAKHIGRHLSRIANGSTLHQSALCGTIACASELTLRRLTARPRTVLNPRRMRADSDTRATKEWLECSTKGGDDIEIVLAPVSAPPGSPNATTVLAKAG